jgi:predicted ATPase/DNA-binding winged helix-turn-helix (wHTH) protein
MDTASPRQDIAFSFGPYRFLPSHQLLLHGQRPIKLGGRALDILHLLVSNAGHPVTRDALVSHVWPSTIVEDTNLRVHIRNLRRALGESAERATYIATVSGRGYRFVAPVTAELKEGSSLAWASDPSCDPLPTRKAVIGRETEIETVGRALHPGRLVTLVGPGGVGKTTIAVEVAYEQKERYPDGICFMDLSTGSDPSLIPHLLATALGVRSSPIEIEQAVISHLKHRETLVIFDNCEHLLGAVSAVSGRIVAADTKSTLLATSRTPLNAQLESVLRIKPLRYPSRSDLMEGAAALSYPSVELFATRARELAGYHVECNDEASIAGLCEALDGLPLAIEMTAAKLDQFTPAEVLRSFLDKPKRGDGEEADGGLLWNTIDWSYSLLTNDEAIVLRMLSIFAGTFEPSDAVQIAHAMGYDAHRATTVLGSLVAKSLLTVEGEGGVVWYRLLEGTRAYAEKRLVQDTDLHREVRAQHSSLMITLFERAEREWNWTDISPWRARYGRRGGDLRTALDWCFGSAGDAALGVRLAAAATRLWNDQSSIFEQMFQVGRALLHGLEIPGVPEEQAKLAVSRAWGLTLARQLGSTTDEAWQQAIDLGGRCADPVFLFAALSASSIFLIYTGRNAIAASRLKDCIGIASAEGDQISVVDGERRSTLAQMHLGALIPTRDKLEKLARGLRRGIEPSRIVRYKDERYVGIHSTLSFLNWLTGRPDSAWAMAQELVQRTGRGRHVMGQSNVLALTALPLALWRGDVRALEDATANLRRNVEAKNLAIWEPVSRFYEAAAREARGDPDAVMLMQQSIADMVRDNLMLRTPMYLGVLAEAWLRQQDVEQAEFAIERALDQQSRCDEMWCLPELLRIKAQILRERGNLSEALRVLREAKGIATEMNAASLELRIMIDLVGLCTQADERASAIAALRTLFEALEKELPSLDHERAALLLDDAPMRGAS